MKKKYIVITTILITSTVTLGFLIISKESYRKNSKKFYETINSSEKSEEKKGYTLKDTPSKSTGYTVKEEDVKDISSLIEGINIDSFNIKFDSINLSRSNLYFSYTITGIKDFGSTIELIAYEANEMETRDNSLQQLRIDPMEDKNILKASGQYKFARTSKNFKDFKFKLKFYDYTKELPGIYRVPLNKSTTFNKVIEMDSRKFYFDEFSENNISYTLKFYVQGLENDSLETTENLIKKYSIPQKYANQSINIENYNPNLSFQNEIFPQGYLSKNEIEENQDIFKDENKIYEFIFTISKHEMETKNLHGPIKLFLMSNEKNQMEFIGEFNE